MTTSIVKIFRAARGGSWHLKKLINRTESVLDLSRRFLSDCLFVPTSSSLFLFEAICAVDLIVGGGFLLKILFVGLGLDKTDSPCPTLTPRFDPLYPVVVALKICTMGIPATVAEARLTTTPSKATQPPALAATLPLALVATLLAVPVATRLQATRNLAAGTLQ